MAPLMGYQSREVINISLDLHSSSPMENQKAVADDGEDRIEDSLDHLGAKAGGPVQPPQDSHAQYEDEDDLYSISPQGKAAADAAKSSASKRVQRASVPMWKGSTADGPGERPGVDAGTKGSALDVAIDDLIANGAKPRSSQVEQHRLKLATRADGGLTGHGSVVPKPAKPSLPRPTIAKAISGATAKPTKSSRNGHSAHASHQTSAAASGTSALAALRARQQGVTSTQPSKQHGASTLAPAKFPSERPASKERRGNVQASTRLSSEGAATEHRLINGKPAYRKLGMFAQTPTAAKEQRGEGKLKQKAADADVDVGDEPGGDASVPQVGHGTTSTRQGTACALTPTSKAAERPHPKVSGKLTYDASELPPSTVSVLATSNSAAATTQTVPVKGMTSKTAKGKTNGNDERAEKKPKSTARKTTPVTKSEDEPADEKPIGRQRRSAKLPDSDDEYVDKKSKAKPRKSARLLKSDEEPEPDSLPTQSDIMPRPAKGRGKAADTQAVRLNDQARTAPSVDDAAEQSATHEPRSGGGRNQDTIDDFDLAVLDLEDAHAPLKATSGTRGIVARGEAVKANRSDAVTGKTKLDTEPRNQQDTSRPPDNGAAGHGKSQEHAIVLSDRPEPSSSPLSSPVAAPVALSDPKLLRHDRQLAPYTPAALHSSPPLEVGSMGPRPSTGLMDVDASRRTTIIGFDRSGPRNQGTRSAKRSAGDSVLVARSSLPPDKVPPGVEATSTRRGLAARHKYGLSSAATSVKSHRTARAAPPKNVAKDVGDALASFLVNPARVALAPTPFTEPPKSVPRAKERTAVPQSAQPMDDADDGWTNLGDLGGDTLVDVDAQHTTAKLNATTAKAVTRSSIDRTASQVAMPPPAHDATSVTERQRAPTVPAMLSAVQTRAAFSTAEQGTGTTTESSFKRLHEDGATVTEPAPKKARVMTQATFDAHQRNSPTRTTQTTADAHGRIPTARELPARVIAPSKRASRRVSRHTSQGVDMHGSPIPKDMFVPEYATTLETFSQQNRLSSDDPTQVSSDAMLLGKVDLQKDSTFFEDLLTAPLYQVKVMSSNRKGKPASPHEDSIAMTAIVLGKVDQSKLIIRDETAAPATDPFTSSEDQPSRALPRDFTSIFSEQLRRQEAAKKRSDAEYEDEDPDKTLVEPNPDPSPKRTKNVPNNTRQGKAVVASSASDLPSIGKWRNALQPHQLNLFDELVAVSHRLVGHLVDQETAMHEAVTDYRKCSIHAIEQIEKQQAHDYQQSLAKMEQQKQAVQSSLTHRSEDLQKVVEATRKKHDGRLRAAGKLNEETANLKHMLAEL
ncbi:hypothetical protein LTR53_000756 [Teratosphaeriaceae sp. CCFEE 6253]|nr:hypothetical protein LTR53_000756 [Teratosphaeriaceae sp. CCFEE 6253]